jgi:hypothetical protein
MDTPLSYRRSVLRRTLSGIDKGELPDYPAEDVFAEARRLLR